MEEMEEVDGSDDEETRGFNKFLKGWESKSEEDIRKGKWLSCPFIELTPN